MDSKVLFQEDQYFRQNKLIYVVYVVIGILIAGLMYLIKNETIDIFSMVALPLLLVVFISLATAKFSISITKEKISFKFFYIFPKKEILFNDIKNIYVKTYDPISDFGGYGFRISGNRTLYSTSGNTAIVIEKKNGKIVYLGTQKADEFEQIKNIL